ncbi:MAG: S-layer family protein, partial [Betaproteobacteria bacterium]|nr:S-layer family protein [Betaproteobacteria bacterium]
NKEKLTLNAGTGGDITFTGAVGATRLGDVIVTNARNVSINNTFAAASLLQSAGTGTTSTAAGLLNTDNSQAGDGVQLTTNNITIGSGGVTTTGAGNAGQQLYDHAGTLAISGDISSNDSLLEQSTAGTGTVTFAGTRIITTTGSNRQVRITRAVTLLNPSSLTINTSSGGGGNVRFDSPIDGTTVGGQNLTVNAGTAGNVRFDSALGGTTRLGAVTISNAQDVTESGGITAASFVQTTGTGAVTLDGAINTNTVTGVNLTTTGAGGTIALNNTLTTTAAGVATFNNGGMLTINGNITADGAVSQTGGGAVTIQVPRTITTTGDAVSFAGNVTLSGGGAGLLTIDTTSGAAAGANITFSGLLNANSSGGNAEKLTLKGGTGGAVLFTGAVGGSQRLGDIIISSAGSVTESAGITAHSLTQSAGNAAGTTLLTGAVNTDTATGVSLTTAGAITANNTITTTSGGGVTFSNGGLLTINGDITSDGAVAQSGGGNVTITAPRTITTTGDAVSFTNNVTLNGGAAGLVTINTTSGSAAGNNITFSGTLNSATASPNQEKLTLNAGTAGDITFTGAVGGTQRLGDVTITNAHNVTVSNTFASASLLQSAGTGTTLTSAGNLNTDNSQTGNGIQLTTNNITVGAGGFTTTNNGIVTLTNSGTLNVNGQINADGAVLQNGAGITQLSADIVTSQDLVRFTQGVVLVGGNRLIDTASGPSAVGTIQFDSTVNGSGFRLTLAAPTATGDIIFNGAASNLSGVVVNSGRNMTIAPAGSITTTNAGTGIDVTIGGTLTHSGTMSNSAGASAINLTANKMALTGAINAGSGPVKLTSFTAGNTIDLGSTTDVAANTLELSNAELNLITTSGTLTIGSTPTVANHTGTIVASTGNNVTFTNPSGLVVLQTSGGNVNINSVITKGANGLKIDTTGGGATTGGIFDPNGTGMLVMTGGGNLNLVSGAGVGTTAKPVHTNTPSLTLNNSTSSDVYVQNTGTVSLATTFRNQAAGGKLWLETLNGAINTGAVAVSTNNGQMILTASDTSGAAGNNAQINIGSGGLTSSGGMIALHGADVVTIQSGSGIATTGGNVEIISGTGAGLNTGLITRPASEVTADDFGAIYIGAPIATGAGNTWLVAATTATPTIIAGVVQGISSGTITGTSPVVSSINPTTGAAVGTTGPITTNTLTVVTLRGAGGAGN